MYIVELIEKPPSELADQPKLHFTGQTDITKRDNCKRFIGSIPGRLDGLVNCAGVCPWEGKLATDDQYRLNLEVNITGTWNMGTEALQRMSQQKEVTSPGVVKHAIREIGKGSIVNIGSGASLRGLQGLAAYSATKHAVLGLTRAWAKDFPQLRVNSVAPGSSFKPGCLLLSLSRRLQMDRS